MSSLPVEIRPSRYSDIQPVAENMRKCDRDEVYASHGLTPLQALRNGYRDVLEECYTVVLETGEPIAMLGASAVPNTDDMKMAGVWFLGTDKVYQAKRAFYTEAPKYLAYWFETFNMLFNIVDLRNTASLAWMQEIGFTIHDVGIFNTHERRPFAFMVKHKE